MVCSYQYTAGYKVVLFFFHLKRIDSFLVSQQKRILWALIRSGAAILMSANNIFLIEKIRKKSYGYPRLSAAMEYIRVYSIQTHS